MQDAVRGPSTSERKPAGAQIYEYFLQTCTSSASTTGVWTLTRYSVQYRPIHPSAAAAIEVAAGAHTNSFTHGFAEKERER